MPMKFRVSHLTRYEYDREVGFAPHILYLRPRECAEQRLLSLDVVRRRTIERFGRRHGFPQGRIKKGHGTTLALSEAR